MKTIDNNAETIYNELLKHVTEKKLKEISVDVINSYKIKDLNSLLRYADILEFDAAGMNISRLFARIIQNYHPDKTAIILSAIEESLKQNQVSELLRYKRIYIFNRRKTSGVVKKFEIDTNETYSYSDDNFGYSEKDEAFDDKTDEFEYEENIDDIVVDEINPFEYGFIEAINRMIFGGIDDSVTVEDLHNLEGELDLSDSEIVDLRGIEHCRNITMLNLSGNHIYKIDRLSGLEMLEYLYISDNSIESIDSLANLQNIKELDISFNSIEDISVLLGLNELVYVNIMDNPVKNKGILKKLEERGVIVIS